MKKILGIIGSHRYLGNGEILTKAVARACEPDYGLALIRLDELRLLPCRGCYKCTRGERRCILEDDLYFLVDKMREADAIIISTPTYNRDLASNVKAIGDRVIAIDQYLDDFWKKPAVVIATHGPVNDSGYALSSTVAMTRMLGLDVRDHFTFNGALPGDCMSEPGVDERIQKMARCLVNERRPAEDGECPYCGCNLWKFTGSDTMICPVCHTPAKITFEDGKMKFVCGDSPSKVFDYEWLDHHFRADLNAGVEDFQKTKARLKAIRDQYKGDYEWLHKEEEAGL